MDFYQETGALILGTRLKRVSGTFPQRCCQYLQEPEY